MARRKRESAAAPLKWEDVPEIPREEQPYPLPEGWKWVRLGNISKSISKGTTPRGGKNAYLTSGIGFLRIENIKEDGSISHDNIKYISEDVHKTLLKRSILEEEDLLITIAGTLGKCALVKKEDLPLNMNQAISFVRLKENIYNKYIMHFINTPKSKEELLKQTKVTSIPNLTLEIINKIPIALPPFEDQQRIVNGIESLFSKLDEAAEKVQAVLDSHEARKQAILHQAFSGELTRRWRKENGVDFESWGEKSLCDITNFIKAGGDKPEDFQENKDEHHFVPVIANGVENNGIIGYTSFSKHFENTLTIAGRGTIGFPFLRNYDYFPVVRLLVVSPKPSKILLKYLYYIFLAFPERGTGSSIPQLTIPKLKEKKIILCKIEEQKNIVNILDKVMEEESSLLEMGKSILERIEYLKKSILEKAFRGNLK